MRLASLKTGREGASLKRGREEGLASLATRIGREGGWKGGRDLPFRTSFLLSPRGLRVCRTPMSLASLVPSNPLLLHPVSAFLPLAVCPLHLLSYPSTQLGRTSPSSIPIAGHSVDRVGASRRAYHLHRQLCPASHAARRIR